VYAAAMNLFLSIMVAVMTTQVLSKMEDWAKYNSSLLIEVTRPNGVFTCTGVAVSDQIVITAAHCLDGDVKGVRVFTQDSYDPKQSSLPVKQFKLHPDYRPKESRYKNDLARIHMAEKLPPNIRLFPIFVGKSIKGELYRFGFGERNKKTVRTVITPTFRKINEFEGVVELNDLYSYSGDSGGPIYLRNGTDVHILAIHSTLSHGPQGNYSYNPMLGYYLSWIYAN
jgi:secreted trypsin-like serine protease